MLPWVGQAGHFPKENCVAARRVMGHVRPGALLVSPLMGGQGGISVGNWAGCDLSRYLSVLEIFCDPEFREARTLTRMSLPVPIGA